MISPVWRSYLSGCKMHKSPHITLKLPKRCAKTIKNLQDGCWRENNISIHTSYHRIWYFRIEFNILHSTHNGSPCFRPKDLTPAKTSDSMKSAALLGQSRDWRWVVSVPWNTPKMWRYLTHTWFKCQPKRRRRRRSLPTLLEVLWCSSRHLYGSFEGD